MFLNNMDNIKAECRISGTNHVEQGLLTTFTAILDMYIQQCSEWDLFGMVCVLESSI